MIGEMIKLNNGVEMPQIGLGTFKVQDNEDIVNSVKWALEAGYRHIDTAAIYRNEDGVGKGIKASGVPREEIFVTTKVWNSDQGYENTLAAFETSLKKLELEYIDLYLVHWPNEEPCMDTWKAMEKLYKDGRVKAIGVSNFEIDHLQKLLDNCEIKPVINQVELHPQFPQDELREFCKNNNIAVESWGPLMQGKIFDLPLMKDLSEKYGKSIAQIALRWQYQLGIVIIPKSIKKERIVSNVDIFDFEISAEDMKRIESLKGNRIGTAPRDVKF